MNLSEKLSYSAGISDLADKMTNFFCTNIPGLEITGIPDEYFGIASGLAASKYHTWEWNYAYGPGYNFSNTFIYGEDTVTCKLSVKDGLVRDCVMEGSAKLRSISGKLIGCRHMVDDFGGLFAKENLPVSENEIFNFF
jgi:lipoate-protein ligase A